MTNNDELNEKLEDYDFEPFDLDDLEAVLDEELEKELSDLDILDEEKSKIQNPDALGGVILDEIWNQFGNQIGLDITNETLIQKYDREHPESYSEVAKTVMKDKRYTDKKSEAKQQQLDGNLTDAYTGKKLKPGDSVNIDHVVPRKELYENKRRRQAGIATEDLANKSENLQATNESLNKSKNDKTISEYTDKEKRKQREEALKKQNERANKKVDESNMSDLEKQKQKEKNDKRLQDKLDADDELMKKADKTARKSINKDIYKGVAKETTKKAGKDALKSMAVSALFALLKDIINGLIRFFKNKSRSFKSFLGEMKTSIKSFLSKILDFLKTGATTAIGTVISEIFGPIVSLFQKLASLIKQGVRSLFDAIKVFKRKDISFNEKILQAGKIVVATLTAGGAIFLGELFEKILLNIPGMQISIPLLGTLANVIGMFLASVVCGVVGAIVINRIDKLIAEQQRKEITRQQIDSANRVLSVQKQLININESKLNKTKNEVMNSVKTRHEEAGNIVRESMENILKNDDSKNNNDEAFNEMNSSLNSLLDD